MNITFRRLIHAGVVKVGQKKVCLYPQISKLYVLGKQIYLELTSNLQLDSRVWDMLEVYWFSPALVLVWCS